MTGFESDPIDYFILSNVALIAVAAVAGLLGAVMAFLCADTLKKKMSPLPRRFWAFLFLSVALLYLPLLVLSIIFLYLPLFVFSMFYPFTPLAFIVALIHLALIIGLAFLAVAIIGPRIKEKECNLLWLFLGLLSGVLSISLGTVSTADVYLILATSVTLPPPVITLALGMVFGGIAVAVYQRKIKGKNAYDFGRNELIWSHAALTFGCMGAFCFLITVWSLVGYLLTGAFA